MPNRCPFISISERGKIMKLNDKVYDVLAWIGKIVLPSLSVLYGTLGKIWNLPFTEQIPMTIMALDVFLNSLLGISTVSYYKDQMESTAIVDANKEDKG